MAAGGWLYFRVRKPSTTASRVATPAVNHPAAATVRVTPIEVAKQVTTEAKLNQIQQTDQDIDGLPDQAELHYGTNPTKADTDGDGLLDADEIFTYKTDPLNPDTDGDGYPDGDEARKGFNPVGPGKLHP